MPSQIHRETSDARHAVVRKSRQSSTDRPCCRSWLNALLLRTRKHHGRRRLHGRAQTRAPIAPLPPPTTIPTSQPSRRRIPRGGECTGVRTGTILGLQGPTMAAEIRAFFVENAAPHQQRAQQHVLTEQTPPIAVKRESARMSPGMCDPLMCNACWR